MINLSEMLGKMGGARTRSVHTTVKEALAPLITEESDKLLDQDSLTRDAVTLAEQEGIVFLDEIDKVAGDRIAGAPMCRAKACSATCCP
jgi:ATP-dependent HslUV protease ATP-binding subunit HslU